MTFCKKYVVICGVKRPLLTFFAIYQTLTQYLGWENDIFFPEWPWYQNDHLWGWFRTCKAVQGSIPGKGRLITSIWPEEKLMVAVRIYYWDSLNLIINEHKMLMDLDWIRMYFGYLPYFTYLGYLCKLNYFRYFILTILDIYLT